MMNKFGLIMMVIGVVSFVSSRNHLLMSLMSVEFLTLMMFMSMIFMVAMGLVESYVGLYMLVMSACEGVLGLSVIVVMARGTGADKIFSGVLLQC